MKNLITIVIVISLFQIFCNRKDEQNITDSLVYLPNQQKIIPYKNDSNYQKSRQEVFLKSVAAHMGLPVVSTMNNDFYLRVWLWEYGKNYVINVHNEKTKNECSVVEFNGVNIDTSNYLLIHKVHNNLHPKNGWALFLDTLERYRIANLNPVLNIQKETGHSITSMSYVQFEVSQRGQYRFYQFLEPSYYRTLDSGSHSVYQFLKYFNREMNIEVYHGSSFLNK